MLGMRRRARASQGRAWSVQQRGHAAGTDSPSEEEGLPIGAEPAVLAESRSLLEQQQRRRQQEEVRQRSSDLL